MSPPLRLALADDQALVRRGLRALLEDLGGLEVVIEAEDGAILLAALQQTHVDVLVSDVRMPRHSGIEVVRALRARGDYTPAILLTTFDDAALLQGAVQAGAQGFLLKDAAPEELKAAILRVAAGETLLSPQSLQAARLGAPADQGTPAHLTERELAVLRLVAGGYSNKEIGRALGISDGTVKNHLTEILYKLEARDRTHAVLKAIGARLL
ncbi:MAG: DNA-binding response regulator [Nevskia sp.]|nr:DNA-binding response regulator [Nevskia sp.]